MKLLEEAAQGSEEMKEMVKKTSEECESCNRYRDAVPRPIVAFRLSNEFNDVLAVDLKIWKEGYILVMLDSFSRYCRAAYIRDKRAETIVKKILTEWISIFGRPRKLFSDNGGEFNNDLVREMCESLNIEPMYTAAESPWSNGMVERFNRILNTHLNRVIESSGEDVESAISWVVSAQNALNNNKGFSPNQIVFGKNPGLSNLIDDEPPALCVRVDYPGIVEQNLKMMRTAKEKFIEMESDERIRRALRDNIRPTETKNLSVNDKVYFKRNHEDRWRGPGTVEGIEGKIIFVRYGGYRYRVHTCRLKRFEQSGKN